MAYSRWGGSRWFTFWSCRDDENCDNAIFSVCGVIDIEASEIRSNLSECIDRVCSIEELMFNPVSELEKSELRVYMEEFLLDVDVKYSIKNRA